MRKIRARVLAAQLGGYFLASTLVFGLLWGGGSFLRGAPSVSSPVHPSTLRFAFDIAGYGVFHWVVLAILTLPIFLLPVAVWMLLKQKLKIFPGGAYHAVAWSFGLGLATCLVRQSLLEYPLARASLTSFLTNVMLTGNAANEVLALSGGLFLSHRLILWIWPLESKSEHVANPPVQPTSSAGG